MRDPEPGTSAEPPCGSVDDVDAFRDGRELLRTVVDHVPAWLALTDADGRYIVANRRYTETFGVPLEQMVGRLYSEVFPAIVPRHRPMIERCRAGETVCFDDVLPFDPARPTYVHGVYRPVRGPDGRVRYMTLVAFDITARVEAEQAVAAEKERLAVTLRSIGDGVITTDADGRVVLLNRVAEELTGWSQAEAAGRPLPEVFRLVDGDTREPCADPVSRVMGSGHPVPVSNHTLLIARDGTERVLTDSGAPIRDADDRVVGVVLVFRDETEKRRLEEKLRQAQKLQALGTLASGIAHDFNNLLTGISSHAGFLKTACELAGLSTEDVVGIQYLQERGAALTQKLLALGRRQMARPVPLDLNALLAAFVPIARRLLGERIVVSLVPDPALPPVDGDPGQLEQALLNLVANARDAMPAGGRLWIETRAVPPAAGSDVGAARLIVRDTGPGLPTEVASRIFEPFYTTKEVGRGTGMGLAVVFGIVEQHGGTIDVVSSPGRGAEFRVTLPGTCRPPCPVGIEPEVEVAARQAAARARTILVAEDDPDLGFLVRRVLLKAGYTVLLTVDGQAAVEAFRAHAAEISLVVLDMVMPRKEGLEALAEMRALVPDLRAVLISGYCESLRTGAAARDERALFLPKPFPNEALLDAVARMLPLG